MESTIGQDAAQTHLSNYFRKVEAQFTTLMALNDLDESVASRSIIVNTFEQALESALDSAFSKDPGGMDQLFLQRILYRINRLKFFWYDDLNNYRNEQSEYLRRIHKQIESAWSSWELDQFSIDTESTNIRDALCGRAAADVAPSPSAEGIYFRDHVGVSGYCRLLEIASLDGLVEASQLSRTLGGVANRIHAMMTRLLVEEYGGGKLARKHSSFFELMLGELGIDAQPEAHFEKVPWEVLAAINHSFMLSERKRFYLRYVGGLLYTEISVPAAFDNYRLAAERLGMSEKARSYWDLHIREDERHGQWMLHDVALPLAKLYPEHASEIVLGYDQQKFLSDRAGKATAAAVKQADEAECRKVEQPSRFEAAA